MKAPALGGAELAGPRTAARIAVGAASLLGFSGIACGAFAAHALKATLDSGALALVDTAARYQMIHAVALLGASWVARLWPGRASAAAIALLATGTLVFSASLYALALGAAHWAGALTPLGGLMLMGGWLALGLAAWPGKRPS